MRRIHTNAPPNKLRIEVYSNSLVDDSMRTCSANCERLSRSIILASQRQGRMRKNKTLKILGQYNILGIFIPFSCYFYTEIMRKDRLLAFVLITTGGLIYILYRPKNLLLFRVSDFLGLDSYIEIWREKASVITLPSFVINSIPAGLWTASYLILICDCTRYYNRKTRLLISLPLPVSAILLEFLQLPGWCPGVFDVYDIICYLIPIIIFIKVI